MVLAQWMPRSGQQVGPISTGPAVSFGYPSALVPSGVATFTPRAELGTTIPADSWTVGDGACQ